MLLELDYGKQPLTSGDNNAGLSAANNAPARSSAPKITPKI